MKISWGTGIVIAIGLFMSFILYFVITMMTNSNYDYQMVVDDYYKQEIGFQDELDGRNNAAKLTSKIRVEQNTEGILLVFPEDIESQMENATIYFYRVNKKEMDFDRTIVLKDHKMKIPAEDLLPGRWDINIRWEMNGKTYIAQEKITL